MAFADIFCRRGAIFGDGKGDIGASDGLPSLAGRLSVLGGATGGVILDDGGSEFLAPDLRESG